MVTIPELIALVALLFFLFEEFSARGRAVGWWGAILLDIAFLWGAFKITV